MRTQRVVIFVFLSATFLTNDLRAQWHQTNGPERGFISCIEPAGDSLFVGVAGFGVFLSTDNGLTWRPTNTGLTNMDVRSITVMGDQVYAGLEEGGVCRSTDYGTTWSRANEGFPFPLRTVSAMTIKRPLVFAGTWDSGVFASSDSGQHWTSTNTGLPSSVSIASLGRIGSNLFAGTYYDGGFLSVNNGTSWTWALAGGVTSITTHNSIAFAAAGGGVYRSLDGGAHWSQSSNGLNSASILSMGSGYGLVFAGSDGRGMFRTSDDGANWVASRVGLTTLDVRSIGVSGGFVFAGTGRRLFSSSDSGASWTAIEMGLANTTVNALVTDGNAVYAGTESGGVFRSTNGGSNWLEAGHQGEDVYALLVAEGYLIAGTENGVARSADSGRTWSPIFSSGMALAISGHNLFAGTYGSGVFLSTDMGNNWTSISTGVLGVSSVMALATRGEELFASVNGGSGVFYSSNNGTSWVQSNTGLTSNFVTSLVASDDAVFAATPGGVFRSTDSGRHWVPVNDGLDNTGVNSLYLRRTGLFAATYHGVYVSGNGGRSWRRFGDDFKSYNVLSLACTDTFQFSGTIRDGVWRRNMRKRHLNVPGGAIWMGSCLPGNSLETKVGIENDGQDTIWISSISSSNLEFVSKSSLPLIPPFSTDSLSLRFSPSHLGPAGTTIYINCNADTSPVLIRLSALGATEGLDALGGNPTEYVLSQNFPNPFNPLTTIFFDVPSSGRVVLEVFNAAGELVDTPIDQEVDSGRFQLRYAPQGFSSGVYFCRIRTSAFSAVRKMLYLK